MALRWGIVSAGKISHDFVSALQTLPTEDHEVIAIAARKKDDAEEFAKNHNIVKSYEGYEALAKDEEIDVVYIGTINPEHLSVSKLMLDHGKHVLCEKPLTINLREAQELVEHAKSKKLFLMEAIWSRAFPVYDELQKQIDSGAIGDVIQVNVDFGFPLTHVDRVNVKELGGSTILDIGVYALQFSQFVFRGLKPTTVVASGHLNKHKVDDSASAVLSYPNGRTTVLTVNARIRLSNKAHVFGTKGMITIPDFWCPTEIITPTGTFKFDLPESSAEFNYLNSSGLAYEAEEVRQCIKKGLCESPKLTHVESLELAKLMDTLRRLVGVTFPQDI
ncbi:hypothetical protein RN001_015707 [Aquatica leii]|uniref:Trans-1,2-dihydrobenzene-1,2-diol dehydrogenase n=1 Tax=Aquatica leii TaxID=1421715 RepID=A0AAN7NZC1_9COLE|nr:hypothetical protein RN001_015707 [Aquatica leii]